MSFDFDAPEDLGGGGGFLDTPGKYHVIVTEVHQDKLSNGELITGGGFSVGISVAGGEQKGKSCNLTFRNGKLDSKDQGKFARKKQAAFFVAAGLLAPADLGKRVAIELEKAAGAHVLVELEQNTNERNGKTYIELAWANVFHLDDPRARGYVIDAEAAKDVDASQRRDAKFFEPLVAKKKEEKKSVEDLDLAGL